MATFCAQFTVDRHGFLSNAARLVLADLDGRPQGKCPAHSTATTPLSSHVLPTLLADLLMHVWVVQYRCTTPHRHSRRRAVARSICTSANAPADERRAAWHALLTQWPDGMHPRSNVQSTRAGKRAQTRPRNVKSTQCCSQHRLQFFSLTNAHFFGTVWPP